MTAGASGGSGNLSGLKASGAGPRPYRWLVLLMAWLAFLVSFIDRLIWTNVSGQAAGSYGLSLATLGVFVTAFYVGYVVSQITTGLLADRFGPRLTLACALVPLGVLTAAFGQTTSLTAGLALQALMGLAAGADCAAGVKLIVAWFDRAERGRAMGLFMTSTSLGVVLTNAIVPQALNIVAWPSVYLFAGVVTSILGCLCYLIIRDNPSTEQAPKLDWQDVRGLMGNRQYLFIVLAGAGGVWGTWGYAIWASALMTRGLQFSAVVSGGIVAVFGITAILGKPAIGWLSDLLGGRRKALVAGDLFLFSALLLLTGTLRTESQFWLIAPFLGLAAFAYSPLSNAMAAEAGGTAAATAYGLSAGIGSIGATVVPLAVGFGFDATGSYEAAFTTLAAGPLLGGLSMLAVREIRSTATEAPAPRVAAELR